MEKKYAFQIAWMIIALLFIGVLFFHFYSSNIYVVSNLKDSVVFIRMNKITGNISMTAFAQDKWQRKDFKIEKSNK